MCARERERDRVREREGERVREREGEREREGRGDWRVGGGERRHGNRVCLLCAPYGMSHLLQTGKEV